MTRMKLVLFIVINLLFLHIKCAKILGVFPAPGYSQFILAEVLMKELANRGHQVTVISPYSPKNATENYRTIEVTDVLSSGDQFDLFELERKNLFTNIMTTYKFGNFMTEVTLSSKKVQDLLHSHETFDLVIIEQFFNDAMKGFAIHFNAPLVLFSSMGITEWNNYVMGSPFIPAINAISYTSYTNFMNFSQRFRNLYGTVFNYFYRNLFAYPLQKEYLQKYFPTFMDFDQIVCNASLMLLNSHITTSENSLLPYNMIEIGGFHIVQNPLSKEVQEYLDSAHDGAILFSLGSNLKSSDLSEETLNGIFKVFSKLKQKILWKFERDFPNKPENIFIFKWLKQSDILAHPNTQLFITHGGLLSTTEAIFYGIPMVGIPIFADQKMNMARASRSGIAKMLPFQELSEETLSAAINETINDTRYQENVRRMSNIMRDRVVRPLDLAMYWIEYVIRHRGIRFESPTLYLAWFQIYMIDIATSILVFLLSFFFLLRFIFVILKKNKCNKTLQSKHNAKKNKKKQQ